MTISVSGDGSSLPGSFATIMAKSPEIFVPQVGSMVEGTVVQVDKTKIVIDIQGMTTGIVAGKELKISKDIINNIKIGDTVHAVIVDEEDNEGVLPLSLRKASQRKVWDDYVKAYKEGTVIQVRAAEANKGGLIAAMDGFKGFLPLSQLSPVHYPRVEGGNSELILQKLGELVGKTFTVKIISLDENTKKLVLSERAASEEERSSSLLKLGVGQTVKGKISGIVSYGIFVTFDGLEGLVHISEIDWGHVSDPSQYGKVGDEVEVMVIGVEESKLSLSMKRMKSDPWAIMAQKYKIGDIVEGTVTRVTPFGAFLRLDEGINGLIHLSEISSELVRDPAKYLEVGETKKAKIITLDLDDRRIGLSIKALSEAEPLLATEGGEEGEKPKKTRKKKSDEDMSAIEDEMPAAPEASDEEADKKPKKKAPAKKKKDEE